MPDVLQVDAKPAQNRPNSASCKTPEFFKTADLPFCRFCLKSTRFRVYRFAVFPDRKPPFYRLKNGKNADARSPVGSRTFTGRLLLLGFGSLSVESSDPAVEVLGLV